MEAQRLLCARTSSRSDTEILEGLRSLLAREGELTFASIQQSDLPSPSTYRKRFGSLRLAHELIGYGTAEHFASCDLRRRIQAQREDLMLRLVALFPHDLTMVRRGGRWRARLRLRTGQYISVVFSRTIRPWKNAIRWQVDPVPHERRLVTLLVRLDAQNASIQDFHVVPNIDRSSRFTLKLKDAWLDRGEHLLNLTELCEAVERIGVRGKSAQAKKGRGVVNETRWLP